MSFFEKLKRDMGFEEKKLKKEKKQPPSPPEIKEKVKPKIKKEDVPLKEKGESEGELALDVYETEKDFVIQSTIAGVRAEDLDISIEKDTVIIRGSRAQPILEEEKKYLYQECYWGPFSRRLILPAEVDQSQAKATMKNGVLTLRIPKLRIEKRKKIIVEEME